MDESTPAEDRAILGSALLYYILATDVIPDYMFPIGYLDDAIAVQIALNRLKKVKALKKRPFVLKNMKHRITVLSKQRQLSYDTST